MKPYFLILVQLASHVIASDKPDMQTDPDTVKDCAGWYNNTGDRSCEYVRDFFGITPDEFHEWNPSVGLDCKPFRESQSYCIITQRKVLAFTSTTTTTIQPSTTSESVSSLGPSPTAWKDMGCYAEDAAMPILQQNMNPNGDASLTIPKCKTVCYSRAFQFAGVQQGDQCWCSSYVGGEWAKNQTDCNSPCSGDKNAICGGKGFLNVFKALENAPVVSPSVTESMKSSSGTQGSASPTSSVNTGGSASPASSVKTGSAARNRIWVYGLLRTYGIL